MIRIAHFFTAFLPENLCQISRWHLSVSSYLCGYNLPETDSAADGMDHVLIILIAYRGKQKGQRILLLKTLRSFHKPADTILIVCAIHDHTWQNGLHSALPSGVPDSCLQLLHGHRNLIFQHFHGSQCQRSIHHLIPCNKRNVEAGIPIITVLQGKINAVFVISKHFRPVLNHFICRTSKFFRLGSDHLCGI